MPINSLGQLVQTPASRWALKHHPRGVKHGSMSASSRNDSILNKLSRSIRNTFTSRRKGGKKSRKGKTQRKRRVRSTKYVK